MFALQLNEAEQSKKDAEERKEEYINVVTKTRNDVFEREKEFNDLTKVYELEKEKEVVLQSDK